MTLAEIKARHDAEVPASPQGAVTREELAYMLRETIRVWAGWIGQRPTEAIAAALLSHYDIRRKTP